MSIIGRGFHSALSPSLLRTPSTDHIRPDPKIPQKPPASLPPTMKKRSTRSSSTVTETREPEQKKKILRLLEDFLEDDPEDIAKDCSENDPPRRQNDIPGIPGDIAKDVKRKLRVIGAESDKSGVESDRATARVFEKLGPDLAWYIRKNGESFSVRITGPDGGKTVTIKRGRGITGVLKIKLNENAFDERYDGSDYYDQEADSKWNNLALESKDIFTEVLKMLKRVCELTWDSGKEMIKAALRAIVYLFLKFLQESSSRYEKFTGRSLSKDTLDSILWVAKFFMEDSDYNLLLNLSEMGVQVALKMLTDHLKYRLKESIDALKQVGLDFLHDIGLADLLTWLMEFFGGWTERKIN